MPYSVDEMLQIVSIRAETWVTLDLGPLCGTNMTLFFFDSNMENSHSVQLLTPSHILAGTQGKEQIEAEDIEDIDGLFFDAKASARSLAA
ncbi:MAG: hypothetical protein SGARI_005704, partial [Bacillariaceae sp.]